MQIRFWGTRGSLPKPGMSTVRYGGNTPCVEIRGADGTLLVLDCGTGAHGLGEALLASQDTPLQGHLLITHTHWDHIQGFPFFGPLFAPGGTWDVYGPGTQTRGIDATLAGQMDLVYFPVGFDDLVAKVRYHTLQEGSFEIGAARITARYLNHPALTLGYRIEIDGRSLVYAVDHEPHSRHQPTPTGLMAAFSNDGYVHPEDGRHVEFLADADVVVHDATYTAQEYPDRVNWGHSAAEQAVDYAMAAHARRLVLFHHDPGRDDATLDALVEACRQRAQGLGSALDVCGAVEGEVLDLSTPVGGGITTGLEWSHERPTALPISATSTPTVLLLDDDARFLERVRAALAPDGIQVLKAHDGGSGLALARAVRPSLVLAGALSPGLDAVEVCRALRAESDSRLREMPIVVLGEQTSAAATAAVFAAGATDYLTGPRKLSFIHARIVGWLLRSSS